MTADEWSQRIEGELHESNRLMERINAALAGNDATLDDNATALDRDREVLARNELAFLDLRTYLQQTASAFGSIAAEQRAARRERREESRERREESRERREESRDFLNALAAILDRLNQDPPPSSA
jgi:hypothetical protein